MGMAKRGKWLLGFFVLIAIMQSICNPNGQVLFSLGSFDILTKGGVEQGLLFLCRILVIMLSATVLSVAGSRRMIQGLVKWKVPYEIAFMVATAIRFIPVFSEEMQNALVAIQLRGIEFKKISMKNRLKIYTYLFMPVVTSMIVKAKALALAMEMRGFRAYPQRTSYIRLKLRGMDYLTMIVVGLLTIGIIYCYLLGKG